MNNLISAFIGALISIMIMINGTLSNALGNYTSSTIIHFIGLVSITIVLILRKSKFISFKGIPIYMFSAGAIGVFTILINNITFNMLGVSLTLALGLLGQTLISILIDHFGLLGMKVVKYKKNKLIGLLFIVLGIYVMAVY